LKGRRSTTEAGRDKQGVRQFRCDICHLAYKYNRDLTRHNRNIHGDLAGPFECQVCKAAYKNRDSLTTHLHLYHKDEQGVI
jgi:uncharacterized C2H2 Zn-finger protein